MKPPPRDVLIVGGDSSIGLGLANLHLAAGDRVTRTTRRPSGKADEVYFDLLRTDPSRLPASPGLVYFCAGITSLAMCEAHPEETWIVNVDATIRVLDTLTDRGAFVVFFSSNLVFDGSQPAMAVDAPRNPCCSYGRQKAAVEEHLQRQGQRAAILRLTKVLGHRNTLLSCWRTDLLNGTVIEPFHDLPMAPVTLGTVISMASKAAALHCGTVMNISASEDVTYEETARHLAALLSVPESLVHPKSARIVLGPTAHIPRHTSLAVAPSMFPNGAPHPFEAVELFCRSASGLPQVAIA